MNHRLALIGLVVAVLTGCSPSAPPEIDVVAASIEELDAYIKANCQGDYRTHVRCLNAIDSKRKKNNAEMRNKKGSLGSIRSEAELFGKK